jgi:hypothetical protein
MSDVSVLIYLGGFKYRGIAIVKTRLSLSPPPPPPPPPPANQLAPYCLLSATPTLIVSPIQNLIRQHSSSSRRCCLCVTLRPRFRNACSSFLISLNPL